LALAAAAGLLTGYTLSLAEQLIKGQKAAVMAHIKLFQEPQSCGYLCSSTWAKSQWGTNCNKAAASNGATDGSSSPGTQHLCELPQIWSNCSQGIYLDVGTNVGVQLRKLYDPQQFPAAAVLPILDRTFGSQRLGVCAIGVEANPHHTQYLEQLNCFFKSKGYQAVVLTSQQHLLTRVLQASF
jgi:hypothetical protein